MTVDVLATKVLAAEGEGFVAPSETDFWQPLIGDGAFALTRSMVVMVVLTVLVALVAVSMTRRLSIVPGKGQFAFESTYGLVRNNVARDMIGEKNFRPYMPLLFSVFLIILVNNLVGVLPGVQFPTMSRIGFPIALTLFVYVVYLGIGFRRKGLGGYFKGLVPAGLPGFVIPLMFFLEVITYFFTRPVTLALRLFGNMFAGHILLLLMALGGEYMLLHGGPVLKVLSVAPFVMAFVLTAFELLIMFLQAYIFTLLAAFYIADSLAEHH